MLKMISAQKLFPVVRTILVVDELPVLAVSLFRIADHTSRHLELKYSDLIISP